MGSQEQVAQAVAASAHKGSGLVRNIFYLWPT
jgi:hypothetical protein